MTSVSTISWIFMATALSSQNTPTDPTSISSAADAINHAVPTAEELHSSLSWLQSRNLVVKKGEKFLLTDEGVALYKSASRKTSSWMKIWLNLELQLKEK